jgi:hypothetical protein
MTDVLVFVPGLLGSELYDGDEKIWPGSGWAAIRGFSNAEFKRLMKPDLKARDIIRTAIGGLLSVYGDWIRHFENMRRLSDNGLMFSEAAGTLVTVPYDWRKSCELGSEELAKVLEKVQKSHGTNAEIHIVAHSLGGLVTRHYLQSGVYAGRAGFGLVKTFVTFGTPHNGAPVALAGALGLYKTTFLSTEQSTELANDPRYTSLYETFPKPDYPLIWERRGAGHLMPHALADKPFATKVLKLTELGYDNYLKFRGVIDNKPYPPGLRRFVLMGTRYETITHFFWTGLDIRTVSTPDAGDGTVSIAGAFLSDAQSQMTGESHVNLIRAAESRRAFAELMDATGLLGADQVQISVRDLSVEQNAPIHMSIVTDGKFAHVTGEIVIEGVPLPADVSALVPDDSAFVPLAGRAPQPFSYNGPEILGATVRLPGIGTPGLYRIAVRTSGNGEPVAKSPIFAVSAH